jgi:hypothetical protein
MINEHQYHLIDGGEFVFLMAAISCGVATHSGKSFHYNFVYILLSNLSTMHTRSRLTWVEKSILCHEEDVSTLITWVEIEVGEDCGHDGFWYDKCVKIVTVSTGWIIYSENQKTTISDQIFSKFIDWSLAYCGIIEEVHRKILSILQFWEKSEKYCNFYILL